MARVSISEAARLADISRATLYRNYINNGVVSVSSDSAGKKHIDTSELLRVFGELSDTGGLNSEQVAELPTEQKVTGDSEQVGQLKIELAIAKERISSEAKDAELKALREQVEDYREREQRLLSQIGKLTDTVKLLESPKYPRLWWQFWK